jgi:hypothetical protein
MGAAEQDACGPHSQDGCAPPAGRFNKAISLQRELRKVIQRHPAYFIEALCA